MSEQDIKEALKQAIKEWMDEKVLLFGKWSLGTIASAGVFALAYFILSVNGFHK
jgi:hypothetical protein